MKKVSLQAIWFGLLDRERHESTNRFYVSLKNSEKFSNPVMVLIALCSPLPTTNSLILHI